MSGIINAGFPGIKLIQRGTITIANGSATNTATITSVDTANSILRFLGWSGGSGSNDGFARLALTNATTITATRSGTTTALIVSYEIVEYYPGFIKSIQRGTITLNNVTTNTATITSVDTTKTLLYSMGNDTNDAGSGASGNWGVQITLTNATTITATVGSAAGKIQIVAYQAVEFY